MGVNTTDIAINSGNPIDLISLIVGSGIIGIIFSLVIRHYDNESKKKATLYYPLYLSCSGIVNVITNHKRLDPDQGKMLFISSSKTLDDILFNHGSVIYLEGNYLNELLSMKSAIDANLKIFQTHSWELLEEKFEKKEFQAIKSQAKSLINLCKNNVKNLKDLSE